MRKKLEYPLFSKQDIACTDPEGGGGGGGGKGAIVVSSMLECHIIIITWDFSGKA